MTISFEIPEDIEEADGLVFLKLGCEADQRGAQERAWRRSPPCQYYCIRPSPATTANGDEKGALPRRPPSPIGVLFVLSGYHGLGALCRPTRPLARRM